MTTDNADAEAFARAVNDEAQAVGADFALVFFSQSLIDAATLAEALARHAPTLRHAGCSTAGEITPQGLEEGHMLAILFPSPAFVTAGIMVRGLSTSPIDGITGDVEALRRNLQARLGEEEDRNVFALCFIDANNPQRYLEVRGTVGEIVEDTGNAIINRIARKYTGADWAFGVPGEKRLKTSIDVESWTTM